MSRGPARQPKPSKLVPEGAIETASARTGVPVSAICGLTKDKETSAARHQVWRALKRQGFCPAAIASAWGCDATTVRAALNGKARKRYSGVRPADHAFSASIVSAWPAIDAALSKRARPARS